MKERALLGQLSNIDLRLLRVFRAVVESGGISAAELELNIGRSTISRHIKDLETRLGVILCRRGRSGFALTDEGQQIYTAIMRLLAQIDDFRAEVNDIHQRLSGNISLAMLDKIAANPKAHIHNALQMFDDSAPNVTIDIHVEPLNEIERGVMEGRFQLGLVPSHRDSSSLDYHPMFAEQMYLYCGHEHVLFKRSDDEVNMTEIQNSKYVGLGYHSPNMEIGRAQSLRRHATVYDQEAIVHFLLSGRYLGYLPDHYAQPFVTQGLMRALAPDRFHYRCDFQAIVRHAPQPSRIVSTFLNCLMDAHSGNI